MYSMITIHDTVRVPPNQFKEDISEALLKVAQEQYEGLTDEDIGVVIAVTAAEKAGYGKVIPGDGAAYYDADITMLIFKPQIMEVVEGAVTETTEFGAFLRTGPIEGLVHVSQIMDEYINYDSKLPGFTGKETSKKLIVGDHVLARVVSVGIKGSIPESKIGYTMRQLGLGKEEWLKIDEKRKTLKKEARPEKLRKESTKGGDREARK